MATDILNVDGASLSGCCLVSPPLLCSCLLFVACATPPTREMDQAQGSIDAARAAGADRYATEQYEAAVKALQSAHDAVGQRDYRLALNYALDSRDRAQRAAKEAASQQAVLRSAAERRLGQVTASLDQAKQRLGAAESARVPRRSLDKRARGNRRGRSLSAKSGHEHSGRQLHGEPGTACGICEKPRRSHGRNRYRHEGPRTTAITGVSYLQSSQFPSNTSFAQPVR